LHKQERLLHAHGYVNRKYHAGPNIQASGRKKWKTYQNIKYKKHQPVSHHPICKSQVLSQAVFECTAKKKIKTFEFIGYNITLITLDYMPKNESNITWMLNRSHAFFLFKLRNWFWEHFCTVLICTGFHFLHSLLQHQAINNGLF
jgi:hypothetical protein